MAEEDESSKTEEPTGKKLEEALKKGQVVQSQEVKTWVLLGVTTLLIGTYTPIMAGGIKDILSGHLASLHSIPMDGAALLSWVMNLLKGVALYAMVPMIGIIISVFIAARIQHPFLVTTEKLKPDISKLSPLKNMKKWAPANLLVEFIKVLAKLSIVGGVVFAIAYPVKDQLDTIMLWDTLTLLDFIHLMTIKLFMGVLIIVTIVAAFDFAWQHYKHMKGLRMTKQEVKDEHKQSDGDPLVKGKLKQIRRERAMQRMMANIPNADVIVTNPTHYAVAIEYKHGQMDVPILVAKGVDDVAFRIREAGEEHGVPIVENPPLARALYAAVEIDEEVPPEHYKTVAEVIGYIMKFKKGGVMVKM